MNFREIVAAHEFVHGPLATDRIFMADGRFGCEADMAGPAAGSTRSLVTQRCQSAADFAVMHNGPHDVLG